MAMRDLLRALRLDPAWLALSLVAWVSLLLAPQWSYLRHQAPGPRGAATLLVVAVALAVAVAWAGLLRRSVGATGDHLPTTRRGVLCAAAHLGPLALWLAPAADAAGSGATARSVVFAVALALLAATTLAARSRPHRRRETVTVVAISIVAFAVSAAALAVAPRGPLVCWLWGFYLLAALVGWGTVANRLLQPSGLADWGQRAAWGLAAVIALGGLLNLTWTISRWSVLALLAAGVGGLAVHVRRDPVHRDRVAGWKRPATLLVLAAVVGLALLQLAAAAGGTVDTVFAQPPFDPHDDLQAYLVFPTKMLALGSMGPEPFEARRMLSLGGQSFLMALGLTALPSRGAHLVEMGLMPLVLVGLVIGYGRRQGVDPRLTLVAAVVALALPHFAMRGNTSALLTGVVLLVSLFRHLAEGRSPAVGDGRGELALTALTAAALAALKSTFLPALAALLAVAWLSALATTRPRQTAAVRAAVTAAAIAVLVLPWMVSILQSSGTLLYPVLGRGFYGGAYTDDFASVTVAAVPLVDIAQTLARQLVKLLPVVLLALFAADHRRHRPALGLALAAVATVVFLVVMGDPEINRGLARYGFPVSMAATIGLLLACFRPADEGAGSTRLAATAGIAVAAALLFGNQETVVKHAEQVVANLAAAVAGEAAESEVDLARGRAIDAVLPATPTALVALERPYLLDFRHHPAATLSLPGMSSPPPGLPVDQGPEAVAAYLGARGITTLAYGGVDAPDRLLKLSAEDIRSRYPRSKMRWVMLRYQQRFHAVATALAASRRQLYHDGTTVVLDLATPASTVRPALAPGRVAGLLDDVWTAPEARVLALERGATGSVVAVWTRGWRPGPRPRLEASVAGRALAVEELGDGGYLLRLPEATTATFDLDLRATPLDPAQLGADPAATTVGLDLAAVEVLPVGASPPRPTTLRQEVSGELDPARAWHARGFYRDRNWTDGDATLDELAWPVAGGCELAVVLDSGHRCGTPPTRSGTRVWVNGLELAFERGEADRLVFRLLEGTREIERVRVVSPTFVPADQGASDDRRHLGLPVRRLVVQ